MKCNELRNIKSEDLSIMLLIIGFLNFVDLKYAIEKGGFLVV